MPDAGRTHGPPATKNAGGSHHRFSRSSPAFPARWCYGFLRALAGVPGLLASVAFGRRVGPKADIANPQGLIPASGDHDHTTSPSARAALVSSDPKRPS